MKKLYLFFASGILAFLGCQGQVKEPMTYQDHQYREGQQWHYQTRKGEENSYLTILKIEKYSDQEIIVHIAIDEAKIKNPHIAGGYSDRIAHLPMNRQALEQSGLKIKKAQGQLPDFTQGYQQWKQAFDDGKAGAFSIPVSEAINYVEQAMNNKN